MTPNDWRALALPAREAIERAFYAETPAPRWDDFLARIGPRAAPNLAALARLPAGAAGRVLDHLGHGVEPGAMWRVEAEICARGRITVVVVARDAEEARELAGEWIEDNEQDAIERLASRGDVDWSDVDHARLVPPDARETLRADVTEGAA